MGRLLRDTGGLTFVEHLIVIGAVALAANGAFLLLGAEIGTEAEAVGARVSRIHRSSSGGPSSLPAALIGSVDSSSDAPRIHGSTSGGPSPLPAALIGSVDSSSEGTGVTLSVGPSPRALLAGGSELATLMGASDTLVRQLDELERQGWLVQTGPIPPGMFAVTVPAAKTIYFTDGKVREEALPAVAHYAAHEAHHARSPEHLVVPAPRFMDTEDEYVARGLLRRFQHEGEAELAAWESDEEIAAATGVDPREHVYSPEMRAAYQAAYDAYEIDGRRDVAARAIAVAYRDYAMERQPAYERAYARELADIYARFPHMLFAD